MRSTPRVGDVDGNAADGLDGVGVKQDSPLAAHGPHLRHGLERSDLVVGRHDRNEGGVGPHRRHDVGRAHEAVARHADARHLEAVALEGPTGLQDRRMLDGAHHRVPAPRRAKGAAKGQVVGFGRAGGEHDLLGLGADERRHLAARLLDRGVGFGPEHVAAARGVAEPLGEVREHGREDSRIHGRRRMVVEVEGGHGEPRMNYSPVNQLRLPVRPLTTAAAGPPYNPLRRGPSGTPDS